jgi:hypothetical protein
MPSMGQTNTNVVEHICSSCRSVRAIHDFPCPKEVWWCRGCWQVFRQKQNEQRRKKRQVALYRLLSKPLPPRSWRFARYKSKGGLAVLSASQRYRVRTEYSKLIERCKREGVPITNKKSASLLANAIHIVKNVRTGKMRSWVWEYWFFE